MKRKKNTGSQMGHNNKIFLRIKYIFLQSILLKHEFIYCYMIVIVLLEIRPNDLHRVKPHFWLKFILEPFAEFSSTIKSKPGLESLMLSRQLVSMSWSFFFSTLSSLYWHCFFNYSFYEFSYNVVCKLRLFRYTYKKW